MFPLFFRSTGEKNTFFFYTCEKRKKKQFLWNLSYVHAPKKRRKSKPLFHKPIINYKQNLLSITMKTITYITYGMFSWIIFNIWIFFLFFYTQIIHNDIHKQSNTKLKNGNKPKRKNPLDNKAQLVLLISFYHFLRIP